MTKRYTWEVRETKLGEAQVVVDNTKEDCWYGAAMSICEILNCKEERIKELEEENEQLKKELKRCKDWINSDKNDYELTLAFIKNKGYSLKDVLEYEKELFGDD